MDVCIPTEFKHAQKNFILVYPNLLKFELFKTYCSKDIIKIIKIAIIFKFCIFKSLYVSMGT